MNVLIVEDEKHTAQLLKEIIEQDDDFLVTATLESIAETVAFLTKHHSKIDLIFLDIQLADGHSFAIFQYIDVAIPVIFCTAFDDYTLAAIQNNGINYILKPFREEEIHAALTRYKNLVASFSQKAINPALFAPAREKSYQESFLTQHREKSIVIYTKDIAAITIEYELVQLYTFSGERHPLLKNLEYIESVCNPHQFYRINRQMLINRNAIRSIEPYFNRKVVVKLVVPLAETPIVSRLKVTAFKAWLETGGL